MTPDQARAQARSLLQSTDALLGALLNVATQLRESCAILADALDQTELKPSALPATASREATLPDPPAPNGHLTFDELHQRLNAAGFRYTKQTLNGYASLGRIPCIRDGKHRYFDWLTVLEALKTKKRRKKKSDETPTEPLVGTGPPVFGGTSG